MSNYFISTLSKFQQQCEKTKLIIIPGPVLPLVDQFKYTSRWQIGADTWWVAEITRYLHCLRHMGKRRNPQNRLKCTTYCHRRMTEPQMQALNVHITLLVKFGGVVPETNRQTHRHAHHNTPLPYQGIRHSNGGKTIFLFGWLLYTGCCSVIDAYRDIRCLNELYVSI